jgi:predicted NBD/HSP70 family sugar kinase
MSTLKAENPNWLGIDPGGTKILAGVYDKNLNVVGSEKRKTKAELGQKDGLAPLKEVTA